MSYVERLSGVRIPLTFLIKNLPAYSLRSTHMPVQALSHIDPKQFFHRPATEYSRQWGCDRQPALRPDQRHNGGGGIGVP